MNMNTCATCKHWEEHKDSEMPKRYGICDKVSQWWDAWKWSEDSDRSVYVGKSLAYAQDGSDYRAWLVTLEDFGCVQWEA